MPLDVPQTSQNPAVWVVNGRYSNASITAFQVTISVESQSTEPEGDDLLQQLVDLLSPRFPGVVGMKSYTSNTVRDMLPS
ncbi:hypothetical protein EDD90_7403 [Streptomyces sp. Ag109_O5-1]|uniref:hypothetical protein n=1 Tax=Streptomyces sp. Ag109_O5-1 TaxID=1938851 RepID=UPI000F9E4B21|nr:hypothetical protein [Streptomyces sp. Ag109_O5-1]RPE44173.1 hypothetical protein EDD90_7403 [Streptomyces sp. Ag109_O5-1]